MEFESCRDPRTVSILTKSFELFLLVYIWWINFLEIGCYFFKFFLLFFIKLFGYNIYYIRLRKIFHPSNKFFSKTTCIYIQNFCHLIYSKCLKFWIIFLELVFNFRPNFWFITYLCIFWETVCSKSFSIESVDFWLWIVWITWFWDNILYLVKYSGNFRSVYFQFLKFSIKFLYINFKYLWSSSNFIKFSQPQKFWEIITNILVIFSDKSTKFNFWAIIFIVLIIIYKLSCCINFKQMFLNPHWKFIEFYCENIILIFGWKA